MNYDHNLSHFLIVDDLGSQKTIELNNNIYSIGRHSDSSIRLNSPAVSRHHGTLIKKDLPNCEYIYLLIDGDLEGKRSQNGILVNGKKIIRHQLKHGDLIVFGAENIKAIYQVEKIKNFSDINAGESAINIYTDNYKTLAQEELQKTLILSEKNLSRNLRNYDTENIERLASFPELSPHPIIEVNFEGIITYANSSAQLCLDNLSQEISLEHPLIQGLSSNLEPKNRQIKIREIKIKDRYYEQYIHYLTKENVIRSYIFDITERKSFEDKLKYHAFHDYLTGIPNREHFNWQLTKSLLEIRENQQQLAVLFIDIDRFKNINETLNHTIGDRLLKNFAERIANELPNNCFFARWGGDEFIVIISSLENPHKIQEIINLIMNSLKEPFPIDKYNIYVTCSLGIAIYPEDGKNEEDLVKNADIALFRAKQLGKNNFQFYTMKLSSEQLLLFELENSLYNALSNQELFLNFQPQLDLKTNTIYGFETLLRWKHPQLGIISPSKFIPLAEETGLIISIGEWVLKEACYQSKSWQDQGFPPLITAVNVSVKQFQQPDFVAKVRQILAVSGLSPEYLELEITETILMQDIQKTEAIINDLSSFGVKFSLDDFGTGYSSLSYLKQFPFHAVKIDKSFIDDVTHDSQDQALIYAIITLGRGYNMKVIAEGVETESQLQILREYKCDLIQGRLLSMPMNRDDFTVFLAKRIP